MLGQNVCVNLDDKECNKDETYQVNTKANGENQTDDFVAWQFLSINKTCYDSIRFDRVSVWFHMRQRTTFLIVWDVDCSKLLLCLLSPSYLRLTWIFETFILRKLRLWIDLRQDGVWLENN